MSKKRRSIRDTITGGISTLAELQEALQTALELEFSTLPPYLCAQWSIDVDPSNTAAIVQDIALQEMLHFGFACNMLTAIGGTPEIAGTAFVPTYPGPLPGGVHPGLVVDLLPMGPLALQEFLQIEYPDNGSVATPPPAPPPAPEPPTIGEFYATISAGFNTVFPSGTFPNPPGPQVTANINGDSLTAIANVADAQKAISEITEQGEGTSVSPDEGTFDPSELAHYYSFSEVLFGNTLVAATPPATGFTYTGTVIVMPKSFPFQPNPTAPGQAGFISTFTTLLNQLQACWNGTGSIGSAIGTMFTLQSDGTTLIKAGATPSFTYQAT